MHIRKWSEIDEKVSEYFKKINDLCKKNRKLADNLTFIVVDHCLQTFESHRDSLSQLGKVAGVILKSSTRVKEAEEWAYEHCNVLDVTKETLKDPKVAIDLILKLTKESDSLVIMDHGGYFSYVYKELMEHKEVRQRLIGIAEVTENGHHKMQDALKKTQIPTLSVARSVIKEMEDAQTGLAICDVSNAILLSVHTTLNSLQHVCVLGYGKIGKSIANACRKRGIKEVTVMEMDPLRAQAAILDGHNVVMAYNEKEKIAVFQRTQILFSATGARALRKGDVSKLRKAGEKNAVLYIASCTSPDDEFSDDFFAELKAISKNDDKSRAQSEAEFHLSPYELFDGRKIYILNEGKAVNFAMGGTPGFEICQVWAGVLYTAAKLGAKEVKASGEVQSLSHVEELEIAEVTQSVFFNDSGRPKPKEAKEAKESKEVKEAKIGVVDAPAGEPKKKSVPVKKLQKSHSFPSLWSSGLESPSSELTPRKQKICN